ncbi:hypothetical protein LZ30DRAFT_81868 [Colletotrichum cereale]|nr:hypothetical protein LZ30DRAFT_81868 [Colletotrichum cereale]
MAQHQGRDHSRRHTPVALSLSSRIKARLRIAVSSSHCMPTATSSSAFQRTCAVNSVGRTPRSNHGRSFGHTHNNGDFVDRETGKRVCENQKGYSAGPSACFRAGHRVQLDQVPG